MKKDMIISAMPVPMSIVIVHSFFFLIIIQFTISLLLEFEIILVYFLIFLIFKFLR